LPTIDYGSCIRGARFAFVLGMSRARRLVVDAFIGASSLCALIAGISIISEDMRAQIANAIAGKPSDLGAMALRAQTFGNVLVSTAGDYRLIETPLIGFAIVAIVLCVLMFRN
jgi:hypothetical protein